MVKKYKVEFLTTAFNELKKLDKIISQRIMDKIHWMADNFESIIPEILTANLKGMYKLRVGDWRIIYTVNQKTKVITIHMIGHRKEIYKQ
ncbi:type II toxin-antitoxin system RelE/ParE family toxin [candidate division WOR-3 bacterium]|nr:type II toxin-antitoxin system RelE/ParE family toxin [candidate division WOR-3 bacterium]